MSSTVKTWLACAILALLYAVEVWAMTHVVHYAMPVSGASSRLRAVALGAGVLESGVLYWIYRTLREETTTPWAPLGACAVVLTVVSFLFTNPSGDTLAYVAYAKQATFWAAYAIPPHYFPPSGFEVIATRYPVLPRCSYGPLWLFLTRLTVGPAATLATAMIILRITGLCFLWLAFGSMVFGMRTRPAVTALLLANPFFYFTYVLSAHNDIIPIALVLAAMTFAVRQPVLAAVVAGLSGLIKLPFMLVCLLTFADNRLNRARVASQLAIALCIGILGSLFGGPGYFSKLVSHGTNAVSSSHSVVGAAMTGAHFALAFIAIVAVYAAVARGTFNAAASFSFVALSAFPYPQYLGWGLPYAWKAAYITAFLIALPVIGMIMQSQPASQLFELAVLAGVLATYVKQMRGPRPSVPRL